MGRTCGGIGRAVTVTAGLDMYVVTSDTPITIRIGRIGSIGDVATVTCVTANTDAGGQWARPGAIGRDAIHKSAARGQERTGGRPVGEEGLDRGAGGGPTGRVRVGGCARATCKAGPQITRAGEVEGRAARADGMGRIVTDGIVVSGIIGAVGLIEGRHRWHLPSPDDLWHNPPGCISRARSSIPVTGEGVMHGPSSASHHTLYFSAATTVPEHTIDHNRHR